jgi:hypothetical protein
LGSLPAIVQNSPLTKDKKMLITRIPFEGFYNSIFDSSNFDPTDSQGSPIDQGQVNDHLAYELMASKAYTTAMSSILSDVLDNCDLVLNFESLTSPKEYNFRTDEIFGEIDENSVNILRSYAHDPKNLVDFTEFLKDNYKSYDSFCSYYSYDPNHWFNLDLDDLDHNYIHGYILYAVKRLESDYSSHIYGDISEELSNYCYSNYDYEYPKLLDICNDVCPPWDSEIYNDYGSFRDMMDNSDKLSIELMQRTTDHQWLTPLGDDERLLINKRFDGGYDLYAWLVSELCLDYDQSSEFKQSDLIINIYDKNDHIILSATNLT